MCNHLRVPACFFKTVTLVLLLVPCRAAATCGDSPCHIIEGRIVDCGKPSLPDTVTDGVYEAERLLRPDVRPGGIAADLERSGVVLTVEVSTMRQCGTSRQQAIAGTKTVKRYFVASQTCETLSPGASIEKTVKSPCCENYNSVPCMLHVEEMEPVPPDSVSSKNNQGLRAHTPRIGPTTTMRSSP